MVSDPKGVALFAQVDSYDSPEKDEFRTSYKYRATLVRSRSAPPPSSLF